MWLKLIVGIIIVAICSLIGVKLAEKRKIKRDIFSELIVFCDSFLCDAGLFEKSVLSKLEEVNGELKITLEGAVESLRLGEHFVCVDKRLSLQERELVQSVINSLGNSNYSSQKNTLDMYSERLKEVYLSQKNDYQKFSQLYIKLGFSCGLIIMVIMI